MYRPVCSIPPVSVYSCRTSEYRISRLVCPCIQDTVASGTRVFQLVSYMVKRNKPMDSISVCYSLPDFRDSNYHFCKCAPGNGTHRPYPDSHVRHISICQHASTSGIKKGSTDSHASCIYYKPILCSNPRLFHTTRICRIPSYYYTVEKIP